MSLNRDDYAPKAVSGDSTLQPVSMTIVSRETNGINPGVYFGPSEDINLFCSEANMTNGSLYSESVPTQFIGVVMGGYFKHNLRVYLIHRTGHRAGSPLFSITRVLSRDVLCEDWWVIPLWVAISLRLPGAHDHLLQGGTARDGFTLRRA